MIAPWFRIVFVIPRLITSDAKVLHDSDVSEQVIIKNSSAHQTTIAHFTAPLLSNWKLTYTLCFFNCVFYYTIEIYCFKIVKELTYYS